MPGPASWCPCFARTPGIPPMSDWQERQAGLWWEQPEQHLGHRLRRGAQRWRYPGTREQTVAERAGTSSTAASCAGDLHFEWPAENDALAALDERVEVGVELAEVGDRQWLHEWRQPLRLAVGDGDLQQPALIAGVVDDVASGQPPSRILHGCIFAEKLVVCLGPPG